MNNFTLLEDKIEKLVSRIPLKNLQQASNELSLAYREQTEGKKASRPYMCKDDHKIAYLALRMPATYAAIGEVMKQIPIPITSLLDIGSGPGTAFWAVLHHFPELKSALLVEKDNQVIQLGKELLAGINLKVEYLPQEISNFIPSQSYSLITAAYSLSELPENALESVLLKLWDAADPLICIIEPGTPYGFKTILQARDFLIQKNGFIVAPCTHENLCPWRKRDPWCHFSTRFNRTRLQKKVKGGVLGYEDEKYSYLIMSKTPLKRHQSRIVKTPIKRSGFLSLTLCDKEGIHHQNFSKKQKEIFQLVKNLEWGDVV